jgi:hypothetical protein
VMIAMNSAAQNFLVFRWQDVAAAVKPNLRMNGGRSSPEGSRAPVPE